MVAHLNKIMARESLSHGVVFTEHDLPINWKPFPVQKSRDCITLNFDGEKFHRFNINIKLAANKHFVKTKLNFSC